MSLRRYRCLALLAVAVLALPGLGCTRGSTSKRAPIHPNPNMDRQPKALPQSESTFFYDGSTMRQPLEGTIARGQLHEDWGRFSGKLESGEWLMANPVLADGGAERVLKRGRDRFEIFCSPCHGSNGNGRGILYAKAKVQCADLSQERLVEMSDGELFDVVSNGIGLMPSMKSRVPNEDRWAIIAHVRELQAP